MGPKCRCEKGSNSKHIKRTSFDPATFWPGRIDCNGRVPANQINGIAATMRMTSKNIAVASLSSVNSPDTRLNTAAIT
jgi:hypothetical protein